VTGSRISAFAAPLAAVLLLAACSTPEAPPPCPPTGVAEPTDRASFFVPGGGQDLSEVRYRAEITGLFGSCEYDEEGVDVDMSLRIIAERGPADRDRLAKVSYFVAIEDQGEITAKEIYDLDLPFEGNSRRVGRIEELEIRVPVPARGGFSGVRIITGLQLTPDQLEYNRRTGSTQ